MKIRITNVDHKNSDESLTLRECGFVVGDIVEAGGTFRDGDTCIEAIRDTEFVQVGNFLSISPFEFEVVEE